MKATIVSALLLGLASSVIAAEVKDGDDVILNGVDYRLEGIDAFEAPQMCEDANGSRYDCGAKAAVALGEILEAGPVACAGTGKRDGERLIGNCTAGSLNVEVELVRSGWALVRPDFIPPARAAALCAIEAEARVAKRGAWAGTFELPYFAKGGTKKSRAQVSDLPLSFSSTEI